MNVAEREFVKTARRDRARQRARHGMRVDGRSVFTIEQVKRKAAKELDRAKAELAAERAQV